MKSPFLKLTIFLATCLMIITESFAQCPTVNNNSQIFCNIESLLISDLEAIDNGGGIAWFDTATSTTALNPSSSLIDGEDYFADNSSGNCGSRIEVIVTILGAPIGLNFQGVCVENSQDATILDLEVIGNDVQWYLSTIGGSPLDINTILMDETIYYADQSSPTTNCRTSRLAIFVNVGIVPIPLGDPIQQFCTNEDDIPTVGDLIASGNNNWYLSQSSASPLDLNTPLIDGNIYFATTIDPPCESESRLEVIVEIIFQNSAGSNGALEICEDDTNTYNLFDSLIGSPDIGGTWSPALASGTGIFDPSVDSEGTYTYSVTSSNLLCEDASASVTITIVPPPNAGTDGTLEICENDTNTYNLFDSLNGSPDTGGTWSPALASGTGIFDPALDSEGTYTYFVELTECMQTDASEVIVSFNNLPDTEGLTISISDNCQGVDLLVTISNAINLADGDYNITFDITGANTINQDIVLTIVGGEASFLIDSDVFVTIGLHQLIINSLSSISTSCNADVSNFPIVDFIILESISPELIEDGNSFCLDDNPTIASLSNNIVNTNSNGVDWYDAALSGTIYSSDTLLEDGVTYYASIISEEGCESEIRLAVTVTISNCIEDILIPDGFSPNGDGINETFDIKNLDVLYPNFKLTIFNRYGNILYEGNINTPQWDGVSSSGRSFGNNELPVGVYFFILEFKDGIRKELQGRVYLNR
ncbi:MAG: gliding motility-associated C-terminal domain-containing protein [Psychroserpens sp.]|uniref:gliding motility-associated C-terminal domain-containing protein n=1 Tax=Psychroserpens sp. TaxID=2020870 RepID=UPI0030020480